MEDSELKDRWRSETRSAIAHALASRVCLDTGDFTPAPEVCNTQRSAALRAAITHSTNMATRARATEAALKAAFGPANRSLARRLATHADRRLTLSTLYSALSLSGFSLRSTKTGAPASVQSFVEILRLTLSISRSGGCENLCWPLAFSGLALPTDLNGDTRLGPLSAVSIILGWSLAATGHGSAHAQHAQRGAPLKLMSKVQASALLFACATRRSAGMVVVAPGVQHVRAALASADRLQTLMGGAR